MTVQAIQMFAPTTLGTTAAALYTVPSYVTILARGRIRFTNPSASSIQVTVYGVPPSGTAGAGNVFCSATTILPGQNLDVDVPVLVAGGTIQALASAANAVVAHSLDGIVFS